MSKAKDWKAEWEKVSKESRTLAKRANQRMVRLEDYAKRENLSEILKFAYKKAEKYIKSSLGVGKSGKPRFKEHIKFYSDLEDENGPLSENDLYKENVKIQRHRIKAMEEFLASESSTLGQSRKGPKTEGIKKLYDKRTETINKEFLKKYGLEMTENDLKRFFESKKQSKLETVAGSRQMFAVASIMKKYNLKTNKRDLEKFVKSHVDLKQYENISLNDLKAKKGESYDKYLDRIKDYVKFQNDPILNQKVINALKEGINVNNIFI